MGSSRDHAHTATAGRPQEAPSPTPSREKEPTTNWTWGSHEKARLPKKIADADGQNDKKVGVNIEREGIRRSLSRRQGKRRSVSVWETHAVDGVERFLVRFRSGQTQRFLLLTTDAIEALHELSDALRGQHTWRIAVSYTQVSESAGGSPTSEASAQVAGDKSREDK